ncbi:MAG: hypothetical protein EBV07_00910 [Proteobacteria bacterium]|nr:hypothetical protein [Pseudomonadota bacterium]
MEGHAQRLRYQAHPRVVAVVGPVRLLPLAGPLGQQALRQLGGLLAVLVKQVQVQRAPAVAPLTPAGVLGALLRLADDGIGGADHGAERPHAERYPVAGTMRPRRLGRCAATRTWARGRRAARRARGCTGSAV